MARPHFASRVEDKLNSSAASVLSRRDWSTRVFPYVGYGSVDPALEGRDPLERTPKPSTSRWRASSGPKRRIPEDGIARVLGRVVLGKDGQPSVPTASDDSLVRRGFKAFFSVPETEREVTVTLGDATATGLTDRGGYFEVEVTGHGLRHGWHDAHVECDGVTAVAPVQIIGGHVRFGIVSDIDDTALITALPRPLIAAWNTFVVRETVRREVPGMAAFYRSVLAQHEDAPVFYLSTGAWNTQPVLTRFLRRHGFPRGTLLLTDWGPTETSWFRSGQAHKRRWLRRLAAEFPHIEWLLVGDDGQHDPSIYEQFALSYPDHVAGVAIRQLTVAQQVLSHGHPLQMDDVVGRVPGVPWFEGPNGFVLHGHVSKVLGHA
ncbi:MULTISPECIES: App1 family protein [Dermacoccus]|uniref:DUF2183 domain-containing protein n=3 Tax=Dermacoccus TaxID=57495 RepID=A0A417Z4B4_9MICO|nr:MULTISPECIES: phosphatase domain-containing protein [Dermacoccus]KLO63853.1 hypothetical protein AA983_03725 [Dermacoccus sp. PE3]MBE7372714.1 DUF2183 domain-containing protein [Dermacoccus barathri]MBZ4498990.1 DUF2183 domain-containing protein [Dermacoccus sp. Tok2021]MCT1987421.1 DUF2183 domain-containing protein [Dermacoccus abyssi]QEH92183.1 DUF2183 domain-containing protein [Dermacoccus abyssi]